MVSRLTLLQVRLHLLDVAQQHELFFVVVDLALLSFIGLGAAVVVLLLVLSLLGAGLLLTGLRFLLL